MLKHRFCISLRWNFPSLVTTGLDPVIHVDGRLPKKLIGKSFRPSFSAWIAGSFYVRRRCAPFVRHEELEWSFSPRDLISSSRGASNASREG
jgi:hypothetical protein